MHLVDDIHSVLASRGGIVRIVPKLTNIINTVIRCGVNLDNIINRTVIKTFTYLAFVARFAVDIMLAVYRLRQNFCTGGFTRSP